MAQGRLGLRASSTLLRAKANTVAIKSVLRGTRPANSRERGRAVNTMTAAYTAVSDLRLIPALPVHG